jgi:hypothetical protein
MNDSLVTLSTPIAETRQPDRVLLEGPHSRRRELWLVLRVIHDFISGFRTLHFVGPCVTVFGSSLKITRTMCSHAKWDAE